MASFVRPAVLIVALVVLVAISYAGEPALTEADFKKMKIKQLRSFLEDRGLNCADCQEKADFVTFCTKNAHVPVLSHKQKIPLPEGTFWDVWADVAKTTCEEMADKKGSAAAKENVCPAIRVATESLFMQHGKRTANKLKKKPDALKKTSWGEPYQGAGRRMMANLLTYCLEEANNAKCSSSSKVQPLMEDKRKVKGVDFILWITNVGIENTNPMYEILKGKSGRHDEL